MASSLNRYQLISRIASGGMATVELAEDTVLGRRVALKRLSGTADADGLSRLRREALLGASVNHPNLVSIYDVVSTDEGQTVIVMEYVEGETLADAVKRSGSLDPGEAVRILSGVAAGLDLIHGRGIVHRDVKPANILLGAGGVVKLADLGIASVSDQTRITSAGSVLGSFSYMAPEQLEDAPPSPAMDIYALAAVGFEALSGRKARDESNPMALAHAIATRPPPDLTSAWPAAPPAAAALLARGMSRDPGERPRPAGEMVRRLGVALAPPRVQPVAARKAPMVPIAPAAPAPRRSPPAAAHGDRPSRRRLLAPALLALLLGAVAVAVILAQAGPAPRSSASSTTAARRAHHATAKASSSPSASKPAGSSGVASTLSSSSTTAASTTGASSGASARTAPAPSASNPVSAVESFYGQAAAHRYASAWALADPAFRNQLEGYSSFASGQQDDRSITFDSANVVSRTGAAATVAVRTTSVRTTGTQHCSGTVQVVPGGGRWLLHQIDINCVPATTGN